MISAIIISYFYGFYTARILFIFYFYLTYFYKQLF